MSGMAIDSILTAAAAQPERGDLRRELLRRKEEAFSALTGFLRTDVSIEILERFEKILKELLRAEFASPLSGDRIRGLAAFQNTLGFLLKYKSYGIKASSPLGYSIFIQNRGEGFSFQRHVTHKTEIFHILDVLPGGYVFICDFSDWQRIYHRDSFLAWLNGEPDRRYERFRYVPQSGDVVVMDRLNVVHTVVGCVLAEFATVSTDMVDRLHDQNEDRPIPPQFSRSYAEARLQDIRWPATSHRVSIQPEGCSRAAIPLRPVNGGSRTSFGEGVVVAVSSRYESGSAGDVEMDAERATCLHVTEGSGRLVLGDALEVYRRSPPTIQAKAGNLFLVPPGAHYGFINDGEASLVVSEHRIPVSVAFI